MELNIPRYPDFIKIDLVHQKFVQEFVKKYPPYSDFNFMSLISWNVSNKSFISTYKNTLIVRSEDYRTGKPVISIIGEINNTKIVELLLTENHEIKLFPEHCITKTIIKMIKKKEINLIEDFDNHDYVYSIDLLINPIGRKMKSFRQSVNRFVRRYNPLVVDFPLEQLQKRKEALVLLKKWYKNKLTQGKDEKREFYALTKVIKNYKHFKTTNIAVYINNKIAGFAINEIVHDNYAIGQFGKIDNQYKGISFFLEHASAERLKHEGVDFINLEQDLGIESLRSIKKAMRPVTLLKKYVISSKLGIK